MSDRSVFKYEDLELRISDSADEGILDILNHSIQGSQGGLRFSLQNVDQRIKDYKDSIRFVSLYRKRQIIGTIGSCFRISGQGNLKYSSSYMRYLAFNPIYQSDAGWKKDGIVSRVEKEDGFKQKTLELFSKPHLLDIESISEGGKHIMYAFLESVNERSKNLVNLAGYEYIRSFLTLAFSRFSPKADKRVTLLKDNEIERMKLLLSEFYKDHSFFNTDYSFYGDKYYVLKENNEIIAGVCGIPASYKIYDVPGIWGWVMMKVLPKAPYYRRLFSPEEFRYIVLDSVYCKEGKEESLAILFETVCAREGYNTGLTWLDDRSILYDKIRNRVKMGALNRMLNAKPGLVYAKFINMTDREKDYFYDSPAYISGFDFS